MYIYIRNWKIMWSSKNLQKWLWTPFEVELPWYYRYKNWKLIFIDNEEDVKDTDVFVWERDFQQYYEKRIEAVWWEKLEDTRVHDELKESEE